MLLLIKNKKDYKFQHFNHHLLRLGSDMPARSKVLGSGVRLMRLAWSPNLSRFGLA
jgi:hypothetical protein